MPKPITVPRLGWSMEEGVLGQWLKAPGDLVRAGEMVFVLEGDKAAHEIESFDTGRLCIPPDAPRSGATVKVGDVIGFLLAEGESAPASVHGGDPLPAGAQPARAAAAAPRTRPAAAARPAGPAARRRARELGIDLDTVVTPDPTGRVLAADVERTAAGGGRNRAPHAPRPFASPRARHRAAHLGIDWTHAAGTGRGGRIRERDVEALAAAPTRTDVPAEEPPPGAPGHHRPASPLRRAIARRMAAGVHHAAPVTLTTKIDAGALVALRARLKAAADGPVPSVTDILVLAAARTLRALPDLNACWYRDGIHTYDAVHVAFAVDTPAGLFAPVVRDADRLGLAQIAERTGLLAAQARAGTLAPERLAGGTFTVTTLGAFGIDAFTPILNLPQAGILGVGRIVTEPVVHDGRLAIGPTLSLSLTFDHRVVDGAPAARWLERLCRTVVAADTLLPDSAGG